MADIYVATTGNDTTGTGSAGNPYASPGKAAGVAAGGDRILVKSGTYLITSTTANVAGGRVDLTVAGGTTNPTLLQGYDTTVGDLTTRPVLRASGITSVALVTVSTDRVCVWNIEIDGNSQTGILGMDNNGSGGSVFRVKVTNCPSGGIDAYSATNQNCPVLLCEVSGCGTFGVKKGGIGDLFGCYVHDNTSTGVVLGNGTAVLCVSESNTGGSSDGFDLGQSAQSGYCVNCVAYNNGRNGFHHSGDSGAVVANCIAYLNAAYGYGGGGTVGGGIRVNCASGSNTSGNRTWGVESGEVPLSNDPFTNAASGDFSLNATAGGGAACRAAGYPGAFPGGLSTGYLDIGAVQHQDSGGGAAGMLWVPNLEGV